MERRNAFTLIELLVVIAIIALLVSILLPSLQKAKEMAKDIVCRSNQHHVSLGIHLYVDDHAGMFPYNLNWYGYSENKPSCMWYHRVGKVPEDQVAWNATGQMLEIWVTGYIDFNWNRREGDCFKCPTISDQVGPIYHAAYGWSHHQSINHKLSNYFYWYDFDDDEVYTVNVASVRAAAVLIGDANIGARSGNVMNLAGVYRVDRDADLDYWGPWPIQFWTGRWGNPWPVDFYGHTGETANMAFVDGHVEGRMELTARNFEID